jgi:hypothetical protein
VIIRAHPDSIHQYFEYHHIARTIEVRMGYGSFLGPLEMSSLLKSEKNLGRPAYRAIHTKSWMGNQSNPDPQQILYHIERP